MATINDGELLLDASHVMDRPTLAAGFAAARAVIAAARLDPWDGWSARFDREGGRRVTARKRAAAEMLANAEAAARRAMGDPEGSVGLSDAETYLRSEREIDAMNLRHLNPARGPHFELAPASAADSR